MVDKTLNYGRDNIRTFASRIGEYKTVLDIGAGHGDDLLIYKKECPDAKLYALEGYEPNVKHLLDLGVEVFLHNLEAGLFPFENESLDVISANQVLEHVKEIFWIFHEISRSLKVGGHLVVGVPNLASLHNRFLLAFGKQPTQIQNFSAHIRGFTKSDFQRFLNIWNDGYEIVDFKGANFYPLPPLFAKPLSACLPNMSWGIFFLLKKTKPYNDEFKLWPTQNKLETNFYVG